MDIILYLEAEDIYVVNDLLLDENKCKEAEIWEELIFNRNIKPIKEDGRYYLKVHNYYPKKSHFKLFCDLLLYNWYLDSFGYCRRVKEYKDIKLNTYH